MEKTMAGNAFAGEASGETQNKLNKYSLACAIIASIISIIFGYGEFLIFVFIVKNRNWGKCFKFMRLKF